MFHASLSTENTRNIALQLFPYPIKIEYRTAEIILNNRTTPDLGKGVATFETSLEFIAEMQAIMRIIRKRIVLMSSEDLHRAHVSQFWSVFILLLIFFLSFLLLTRANTTMVSARVRVSLLISRYPTDPFTI